MRTPMRIGQVYHWTPLVRDLPKAAEFFERFFNPLVMYRGYEAHVNNRDAALMVISDFIIEPMAPRAPWDDKPTSPHRRYLERFGECVHSLAVYVEGKEECRERMEAHGIRVTDGGMPMTVFTHPKDFPGLIEFFEPPGGNVEGNPRQHHSWRSDYWREVQPLGIEYASHVTLAVRDADAAAQRYREVFDCPILDDAGDRTPGARSRFVAFGEDVCIELAEPRTADSPAAAALERVGESWISVTFKVASIDKAREWLTAEHMSAPIASDRDGTIRLDPKETFGSEYCFTEIAIDGHPRG